MPNDTSNLVIRRFQCRHIFTDGHRCGSPCLRGEDFCYYHHATRRPLPLRNQPSVLLHDPYNDRPDQTAFTLPLPEDHSSVQHAIGTIMNQLASNALDPRRAGLLLYALQIASGNLATAPRHSPDDIVQEVTLDPTHGPLAPEAEIPGDESFREFLESLDENDEEDDEDEEDEEDDVDEDDDNDDEEEEQRNGNLNFSAAATARSRFRSGQPSAVVIKGNLIKSPFREGHGFSHAVNAPALNAPSGAEVSLMLL